MFERRGQWHMPKGWDRDPRNPKAEANAVHERNLAGIGAYLTGVLIHNATFPEDAIHALPQYEPYADVAFPFLVGVSASRIGSALKSPYNVSGTFGMLFGGVSWLGGSAMVLVGLLSRDPVMLEQGASFVAGVAAGSKSKI